MTTATNSAQKIADRFATAVAGDLIWYFDPRGYGHNDAGKAIRGAWSITEVTKVTAKTIETPKGKFVRETGVIRGGAGYNNIPKLNGSKDRESSTWTARNYKISEAVRTCGNAETLKAVAALLGIEFTETDFSAIPEIL